MTVRKAQEHVSLPPRPQLQISLERQLPCLLITYDLNKPGQKYDDLYGVIKGLGSSWWHYLDSTWLVSTMLTPNQAYELIKAVVDESDSFLVLDVTGDHYQGWLEEEAWVWIRQHLRRL